MFLVLLLLSHRNYETRKKPYFRRDTWTNYYSKYLLKDWSKKTEDRIVTNIVYMGMGEPLLNYNNVINSINIICDSEGLAFQKEK